MSTASRRHRHIFDHCAQCAAGATLAVLLATSAWAATSVDHPSAAPSPVRMAPLGDAPLSAAAASRPLVYAQVKSLWKGQQQPAQAQPPAADDDDDEPEEGPPGGPPQSQNQPPVYQQPAQVPGQPPGYPQQPGQRPLYQQPAQVPGQPPGYPQPAQRLGQPPMYGQPPGQMPGQPPNYPQQPAQRPGQPPTYGQQPAQPPGFPPGYPQQPAQMPAQPQPAPMQGPPPRYGQQPGQPPGYGQQPGQPPGYQQTQRPGQPPAAGGQFQYRGFRIDATAIANSPQSNEILAGLARQIDSVIGSGVRPEIAQFFQSQPIAVRSDIRGSGHFSARDGGVAMAAAAADPNRATLLHQMLHAYHWHVLPQGYRNPQIIAFYERARDGGMYPPNSRALRNAQEFFALTASGYLSGTERAARFRQSLQQRQPDYYQWLGQLFGVQK